MCSRRIASASGFAPMSSTRAAGAAYGLTASLMLPPLGHPLRNRRPRLVQRLADDVHEIRLSRRQGLPEDGRELRRIRDAIALDAERLGDPRVVGLAEIDREI